MLKNFPKWKTQGEKKRKTYKKKKKKTTNPIKVNGNINIHIDNYLKCKWTKFSNQKTKFG